jgi:hypothetical protein
MTSPSDSPARSVFWRARDSEGRQLVVVDDRYTWAWCGTPDLEVGVHVVLPGNPWTRGQDYRGEVTALGSDYLGPVRCIRGNAEPSRYLTFDELMLW